MINILITTIFLRCLAVLVLGMSSVGASGPQVILDPGHGGSDSGAVWGGRREKDVTLDLARRVKFALAQQGVVAVLTRNSDVTVSLAQRAAMANQRPQALFVSLHLNASENRSAHGLETFFYGERGRDLALRIHQRVRGSTGWTNRGVKSRRLSVLRHTVAPAALVECGFLSHRKEASAVASDAFQIRLAASIARGIVDDLRARNVLRKSVMYATNSR
jgi:N-acetylmuramoyl-L-alanine amidase